MGTKHRQVMDKGHQRWLYWSPRPTMDRSAWWWWWWYNDYNNNNNNNLFRANSLRTDVACSSVVPDLSYHTQHSLATHADNLLCQRIQTARCPVVTFSFLTLVMLKLGYFVFTSGKMKGCEVFIASLHVSIAQNTVKAWTIARSLWRGVGALLADRERYRLGTGCRVGEHGLTL
jgi:hypothetical protein